jgi:hypothetical protein
MELVNRANLPPDRLASIESELPQTATLLELFSRVSGLRLDLIDVVTQDEFTHDLVFARGDGLHLVYGAT